MNIGEEDGVYFLKCKQEIYIFIVMKIVYGFKCQYVCLKNIKTLKKNGCDVCVYENVMRT